MLVCNVSQLQRRAGIAADVAEAAAALDSPGTGNVVFATLVDDPASVGEIVDAYLGEIMLEAASAVDLSDASLPVVWSAAVVEPATAVDVQDAAPAVATATWEAASVAAVTLSGGNLVATNTGTSATEQGAKVASAGGKASGKYYFEVTVTNRAGGGNVGIGVGTYASTYSGMGQSGGVVGTEWYTSSGNVWSSGSNLGAAISWVGGIVCGLAIDLDNRKFWIRNAPSGDWDGTPSHNPATNTGGYTIPAGTMVPYVTFGGTSGVAGNVFTANFGASAFVGAVPSSYTAGWPV